MKRLAIGTCCLIAAVWSAGTAAAGCSDTSVELRGDWGQARFSVELADDPVERSNGLMHREKLAMSAGMLFIYETPQQARFWMKNTLIPLDMIFIDGTGVVTAVHHNAIPLDLTSIDGGSGVIGVLEINGGLAKSLGIGVGSQIRHPKFDNEIAVWPCEAP